LFLLQNVTIPEFSPPGTNVTSINGTSQNGKKFAQT
jgi:hypothetical protein